MSLLASHVQRGRYGLQRRVERISQGTIEVATSDAAAAFLSIRAMLLEWLQQKAGGPLPLRMQQGETGELNAIGVQRVETAALDNPRYWAARQDDQDSTFPRRTWVTEAALAMRPPSRLLVGHRLQCVTLGEAAPFSRSVPRFMREIARRFHTELDDTEINLAARRAETPEDVEVLADLLKSPMRKHPVIGISSDSAFLGGRNWLVDPDQVANEVFGVAHVWVIGREASFRLSDIIGRDLSVFHGGVRSWRFPLSPDDSTFGHPVAIARRIAEWRDEGPIAFQRELVDWALRFSAGRGDADRLLPAFSDVRQAAARLAKERAKRDGKTERELLELALSENDKLTREMEDRKEEHEQLIEEADNELRRIESERDNALAEAARLRMRVESLNSALRRQRHEAETPIPESLAELSTWAANHMGDSLILLPRAIHAAKKSLFEDVPFVYRALLLLRDRYVPMRRGGAQDAKSAFDAAMAEMALELTPSFSGGGAGKFGDEYKVSYGDHTQVLDMHLKGSNSRDPRYCFRCYFFWDDERGAVVIGSLPGHLKTDAT